MDTLLDVQSVSKEFLLSKHLLKSRCEYLTAVNDVSLGLRRGESLGVVGESGSGKTTLGKMIAMLLRPTRGRILYEGRDIWNLPAREQKALRKDIQMIFQDPFSSLDPTWTVERIIAEGLVVHGMVRRSERRDRVAELMARIGLPEDMMARKPHEFSGGQRQRIGIARALATRPSVIIGDEPVSALDVSVQAQVINLLGDIKESLGLSYIIISHDLAVIQHMCDRIAVLYLGQIVEIGETDAFYSNPLHPYSEALLRSVPSFEAGHSMFACELKGEIPSLTDIGSGCCFCRRCPSALPECFTERPPLRKINEQAMVACHLR